MGYDVLIVEDDSGVREALSDVLADAGLSVLTAEHGQEALRLLQGARPKAIILDLMMPVMNGWRTVESVRANPETAAIPIIAISAFRNVERPRNCDGFLRKPVTEEAVLAALRPYVGKLLQFSPNGLH